MQCRAYFFINHRLVPGSVPAVAVALLPWTAGACCAIFRMVTNPPQPTTSQSRRLGAGSQATATTMSCVSPTFVARALRVLRCSARCLLTRLAHSTVVAGNEVDLDMDGESAISVRSILESFGSSSCRPPSCYEDPPRAQDCITENAPIRP